MNTFTQSGSAQHTGSQSTVIAPGASLVRLPVEFAFTEGPAVDAAGNVFFTDQPNNRIWKWTPDGGLSVFMEPAGRANGMYFDHQCNLIACADQDNQLWQIDAHKNVTVLVRDFEGQRLNGPNDVWVHPNGGMYFTDPFYLRAYWQHSEMALKEQSVYHLAPDLKTVRLAASGLVTPNGIVGTPDGKTLFVSDLGDEKTYAYDIGDDGGLSGRRLVARAGSDGMTRDTEGNLYLTNAAGVTVFDTNGGLVEVIAVPEAWTGNVAFAGPDKRTLFITASKSVYTLRMKTQGQ